MTTSKEKLINKIIDGFQDNHGKASLYCFAESLVPEIIYNIIVPFSNKHHDEPILVCVGNYEARQKIVEYLNKKDVFNEQKKNVKILSSTYVVAKYHYSYKLTIIAGINDDYDTIKHLSDDSKFTLCILTKNIMNVDFINSVRKILPCIDTANSDIIARNDSIYSPVEETRIGIELSDKNRNSYDKYTDYITECLSIFEDLSNIEKCKKGDSVLGITAADFRDKLAKEHGWRENLDPKISFMKQIDDIYNPNLLAERAYTFYNIAKDRRDLVTDSEDKLDKVYHVCYDNRDKAILIISKRGDYAAKVTDYINKRAEDEKANLWCRDYHDCIETKPLVNLDGTPVLHKSGIHKGEPTSAGWQKQSSINEALFNQHAINVLSIKSSSNPKLKIAVDIVIFTSPLCDDIIAVKHRFANIEFKGEVTKAYKIYCINTIESEKMNKERPNPLIKVVDDYADNFIDYDENTCSIIL